MHFAMQRFDLLFPDYSARNHSEPSKGRKGGHQIVHAVQRASREKRRAFISGPHLKKVKSH